MIVRDGHEVLIPKDERKKLIDSLHHSHMSADSMLRLAKVSFFWPKMKAQLVEKYKSCNECLTNSNQKVDKPDNLPQDLTAIMPGEQVSVDYCDFGSKSILVIVDKVSSHMYAMLSKDKTFESAQKIMLEYFHHYSLPYLVTSDGGPCFRNKWSTWLDSIADNTHTTSAYRASSNGLVERQIGRLKASLERIGSVTKESLLKLLFELNTTAMQDGTGSPSAKFFGRGVRSYLPNSLDREIERRLLVKKRHAKQVALATAKGRASKDVFKVGDRVRVRNILGGRWDKSGTIIGERQTGTASPPSSFTIEFSDGSTGIRHKSYLKFDVLGTDAVADNNSEPRSVTSAAGTGSGGGGSVDAVDAQGPVTRSRTKAG